jgi:L-ascorbate metabolism protein UlaG (beta-lactamase superfamily)
MRFGILPSLATAIVLAGAWASAQRPRPDTIPATGGDITIAPINHATLQLVHGPHIITVDPTSQGNYDGLPKPTLILLTDIHGDHLDPKALAAVRTPTTKIVIPQAAKAQVPDGIVMSNGQTQTIDGLTIEAVPMYNMQRGPSAGQLYHPKGRGNGYIITMGGRRIYIAGDTECTPEMKALTNIDVAFVPMNLPYTMPPDEAAACVAAFTPKVVYPYHYRGSDLAAFEKPLEGSGIEVRLRNWYE